MEMTNEEYTEYSKYRKMWTFPEYHQYSPGEAAVPIFLERTGWSLGDTVLDMGCGTGRAGAALKAAGLNVYLVDLCPEAVEVTNLTFLQMCLWNIPAWVKADWIFCVDVLEHIPFKFMSDTIFQLARATRYGGYIQIACFEDSCGNLIGEKLHLTVKDPSWWRTVIEGYFTIDIDLSEGEWAKFIVRNK